MRGRRSLSLLPNTWVGLTLFWAGCTTVLSIDGDYVIVDGGSGGTGGRATDASSSGSGGMTPPDTADASPDGTATGGREGGGGAGGVPLSGGTGGLFEEAGLNPGCGPCAPGEKCCGGACIVPTPIVGCAVEGCEPCLEPQGTGTVPVCDQGECREVCAMGYVEMGGTCVPASTGGSGGGGPRCNASQCPCFLLSGIFSCCTTFDTCGCTFAPTAYCFPS